MAGVWLEYVLRKGWPLLAGQPMAVQAAEDAAPDLAA
jgi:hypothetical protein